MYSSRTTSMFGRVSFRHDAGSESRSRARAARSRSQCSRSRSSIIAGGMSATSCQCFSYPVIAIEDRFARPSVMGVVNVTPDSFSDGGVHLDPDAAAEAARRMVDEGAAIVDVGGESTRPGSDGVSADEELRRVVPVLDRLGGEVPVSIDTAKAVVASAAVERGAILVNDVTALRGDPDLAGVVAGSGAYLCLMHMQGQPRTMQAEPQYDDVAAEVASFLEERLAFAMEFGIPDERICLDPGIGFGKTVAQ